MGDARHAVERVRAEGQRERERVEEEVLGRVSQRIERQLETIEGLVRDKGVLQDRVEEYIQKVSYLEK